MDSFIIVYDSQQDFVIEKGYYILNRRSLLRIAAGIFVFVPVGEVAHIFPIRCDFGLL